MVQDDGAPHLVEYPVVASIAAWLEAPKWISVNAVQLVKILLHPAVLVYLSVLAIVVNLGI